MVKPISSILVALAMSAALAACAYKPESKANLLTDAGFKKLSLTTPAQAASFKKLPAHRLSQTVFKGKPVWVYPDRNVCGCLYVGTQASYDSYMKAARQQMIDTIANKAYDNNDADPYNPTAEMGSLDWGDAWDDADAYGLYVN